ncbi:MAG: hypothetical protein AAFV07_10955 [Bacteroidota bacterium]
MEDAFEILAHENEKTRTLYTKKIVGLGKKAGLAFHEDWKKSEVEAGPLPALFCEELQMKFKKVPCHWDCTWDLIFLSLRQTNS